MTSKIPLQSQPLTAVILSEAKDLTKIVDAVRSFTLRVQDDMEQK